ncbi:MAG: 16S rRNA pseudouridine(516) synthase [Enterococcus sp.]
MRLDKLIETQLKTSRKAMKRLFLMGHVLVDNQKEVQTNRNVDSQLHQITVKQQTLQTQEVYYLLNKPQGVVTANSDQEHQTVTDLLPENQRDVYAVGRLDRDTTGLIFLTSNGQLGYELLHPSRKVVKIYQATINDIVTAEDIKAFAKGIVFIGGVTCQPAKLEILQIQGSVSQVQLTIQEGKFHQVKKMFLARGKKVLQLKRIQLGPLVLPSELEEGAYRELTPAELETLRPYFR